MRRNRVLRLQLGVSVTTTLGTTADSASPAERLEFADYVARRRPALLRTARAITRDPHSAEDLVQTALIGVYHHWSAIRDPRAADAYTRRAMRNNHTSWFRQNWRTRERSFAEVPDRETSRERRGRTDVDLWRLVMALPPAQRSAVALRHYEGLSVAEAAEALGCSPGTVKSNTSRGLSTLRRWIGEVDPHIDLAG